jgi:hypothetical protein
MSSVTNPLTNPLANPLTNPQQTSSKTLTTLQAPPGHGHGPADKGGAGHPPLTKGPHTEKVLLL